MHYIGGVAGTTNTQFAVAAHALTLLALLPPELQTSDEMAVSIGTNAVHVRRVLARLRSAGLISSRPGPQGGWRLLRAPAELSLADVWRAVHGDGAVLGIHDANPGCPIGQQIQASLEKLDRVALGAIESELETTTLADLAEQARPRSSATTA